jgi:hypothetical protein
MASSNFKAEACVALTAGGTYGNVAGARQLFAASNFRLRLISDTRTLRAGCYTITTVSLSVNRRC